MGFYQSAIIDQKANTQIVLCIEATTDLAREGQTSGVSELLPANVRSWTIVLTTANGERRLISMRRSWVEASDSLHLLEMRSLFTGSRRAGFPFVESSHAGEID
jgi:hypothetical protein